jgi:hypothetical protein
MTILRNMPFSSVTRAILAISCAVVLLATQSQAREILALLVPGQGEAPEKVFLVGRKSTVELELPQRNLSAEQQIPKGDLLLAALPEAPDDPKELPEGAPLASIPANWKRCLVVFVPAPENKVFPYRPIPLDISVSRLKKGETLVLNLSNTVVSVRLGKKSGFVAPGKTAQIGAPRHGFGAFPVEIDCLVDGEEKPRAVFRSMWQHDPMSRQILLAIPQEGRKTPRIWGVLDQPRPKKGQ